MTSKRPRAPSAGGTQPDGRAPKRQRRAPARSRSAAAVRSIVGEPPEGDPDAARAAEAFALYAQQFEAALLNQGADLAPAAAVAATAGGEDGDEDDDDPPSGYAEDGGGGLDPLESPLSCVSHPPWYLREYQAYLRGGGEEKKDARPLPVARRAIEELFLRTPKPGEHPCVHGAACEAHRLCWPSGAASRPFVAVAVQDLTSEALPLGARAANAAPQDACLLCRRFLYLYIAFNALADADPLHPTVVVPPFRNLADTPGEYRLEDTLGPHSTPSFATGVTAPVVFHDSALIRFSHHDPSADSFVFTQTYPTPGPGFRLRPFRPSLATLARASEGPAPFRPRLLGYIFALPLGWPPPGKRAGKHSEGAVPRDLREVIAFLSHARPVRYAVRGIVPAAQRLWQKRPDARKWLVELLRAPILSPEEEGQPMSEAEGGFWYSVLFDKTETAFARIRDVLLPTAARLFLLHQIRGVGALWETLQVPRLCNSGPSISAFEEAVLADCRTLRSHTADATFAFPPLEASRVLLGPRPMGTLPPPPGRFWASFQAHMPIVTPSTEGVDEDEEEEREGEDGGRGPLLRRGPGYRSPWAALRIADLSAPRRAFWSRLAALAFLHSVCKGRTEVSWRTFREHCPSDVLRALVVGYLTYANSRPLAVANVYASKLRPPFWVDQVKGLSFGPGDAVLVSPICGHTQAAVLYDWNTQLACCAHANTSRHQARLCASLGTLPLNEVTVPGPNPDPDALVCFWGPWGERHILTHALPSPTWVTEGGRAAGNTQPHAARCLVCQHTRDLTSKPFLDKPATVSSVYLCKRCFGRTTQLPLMTELDRARFSAAREAGPSKRVRASRRRQIERQKLGSTYAEA